MFTLFFSTTDIMMKHFSNYTGTYTSHNRHVTEILHLLLAYCILLSYICTILANKHIKTIYFCKKH